MRIALTISILLLAVIAAKSQKYHVSPAYYPIEQEIAPVWRPSEPYGADFGDLDPEYPEYGACRMNFWQKHKKGILVAGIQLGAVILDAAGDAVYDMGKESGDSKQMAWGHTMQATALAGMGATLVMLSWDGNWWDGVRFGVGYVAMRYAAFDLTYNLTRGIDPLYADGWKAKMPPQGRAVTQTFAFMFSMSWNILEF